MLTKRDLVRTAAMVSVAGAFARFAPALAQTSADRPGFLKAKDIAEAGFVYGLPIVMNYFVMYEYAVDRSSSQIKKPFNQIVNEHRTFTYEDTSVIAPNSDTPYSGGFLDLAAEPIVLSVPAVDPKRQTRTEEPATKSSASHWMMKYTESAQECAKAWLVFEDKADETT